jgi:methyl-accepting chemotaxis protein
MRRGAAKTSRALEEQTAAAEQVANESKSLARQIINVSRAMDEQATAATQITTATKSMRQQSDQAARAMVEQTRAAREMTTATQTISKEIQLITLSNRGHLESSQKILGTLTDIREITERNGRGVEATLEGTTDLAENARQLASIMDNMTAGAARRGAKPARRGGKSDRSASNEPTVEPPAGGEQAQADSDI